MANSDRMIEWTMKIVKSFNSESFTGPQVVDRWDKYASARYQPNGIAVSALLKRLVSKGQIRRTGDRTRFTNFPASADTTIYYKEV
jgi:hypothetical protein